MTVKVRGIAEAQAALNEAVRGIELESELMVSVILQGIAANTAPYIPVESSFLINSEYRTTGMTSSGPRGELGYGASYAGYVYRKPGKLRGQPRSGKRRGRYWDAQGGGSTAQPMWLDHGVRDFIRDDLSGVIARFST